MKTLKERRSRLATETESAADMFDRAPEQAEVDLFNVNDENPENTMNMVIIDSLKGQAPLVEKAHQKNLAKKEARK